MIRRTTTQSSPGDHEQSPGHGQDSAHESADPTKTQRTEHAREVTQAEAAGTDRPTQAPDEHDDRLGPSLPQTVTPLCWPTRAAQAADGIDTERRRRREAAVPVAPKPPPWDP